MGSALLEIRDGKLYRDSHDTFEDYCRERWGMSKTHANRLVQSAEIAGNLTPIGVTPASESQTRALAPLEPEQQREAWSMAVDAAPNGKPTAFVVSLNLHRRHLTESQRAMVAAKIKPRFEAEAKERQGARTDIQANLPECSKGQARDKAAALVNVSPRLVESGSKVLTNGTVVPVRASLA